MAIYINGKQLEPKKEGSSMEKKYYEDIQELKKLFAKFKKGDAPAVLVFKREWAKKWNNQGTSFKPAPPINIPLRAGYYDKDGGGAIDIRYSESYPDMIGNKLRWNKPTETIYEMYSVTENQMDLAWFLLRASKFFEKGVLKLVDLGVEIEAKWDTMALQADVATALKNITEDDLAKVYIYFLNGKFKYIESESVKVNAMRLWDTAIIDSKNDMPETMNFLKEALDKVVVTTAKSIDPTVVVVDEVEYPVLELPEGMNKKSILQEAANYGVELPTRPLKNEVLYTILQAKIEKLK